MIHKNDVMIKYGKFVTLPPSTESRVVLDTNKYSNDTLQDKYTY